MRGQWGAHGTSASGRHIEPFADVGQHEITNGVALRSDIHTLFDLGYVTVTPDYHFKVSER